MKIDLVSGHNKNWDAGASTVFLHLDKMLHDMGHDTTLFHAADFANRRLPATISKHFDAFSVRNRFRTHASQADVVEVAGNLGWVLFKDIRKRSDVKSPLLVTRIHGLEFKDQQARITEEIAQLMKLPFKYRAFTRHWINWQEFESIKQADLVLCYTSRDTDAIVTAGLKPEHQVAFVPAGVDERFFGHHTIAPVGNRILWWGSWVDRKGIFSLPRTMELAIREMPDLHLTLGGTGKLPEELLPLFPESVRSRVTVLPFVSREEQIEHLQKSDIFLFPSLSEGYGLALLEAMAAGLPCITTYTGIAYDRLEHDLNAIIVPMSAPTALAKAVVALARDSQRRESISLNGQKTARDLTWGQFAGQTVELYESHLKQKRSASLQ